MVTGVQTRRVEYEAESKTEHRLSETDRSLLAFEGQWFRQPGSKEQSIRDTFGLNVTRYYQWVNAVIDDPAAMEYDPVLVKRLRRARDSRMRAVPGGAVRR